MSLRNQAPASLDPMDLPLNPGVHVLVYTNQESVLVRATILKVNRRSITIQTDAGRRTTIPPDAMAPGERDRQQRLKVAPR